MINKLKWYWWRLTGYRELSKLLHAHMAINHDALTKVGAARMQYLLNKEDYLFINAFRKHWKQ